MALFHENKNRELISEHFDITKHTIFVEILMPDGRYLYYEFEPNHKLREKITWQL